MKFTISYSDEDEKARKLVAIVRALGYEVTRPAPRVTVGQLANTI